MHINETRLRIDSRNEVKGTWDLLCHFLYLCLCLKFSNNNFFKEERRVVATIFFGLPFWWK